mgnify:CR=1 FL=1
MQGEQNAVPLFDPMPKRDVELPPLVTRPVEPAAGSLRREAGEVMPTLEKALANVRF